MSIAAEWSVLMAGFTSILAAFCIVLEIHLNM